MITGASPSLWLAKDKISNAAGPFPATWLPLLGHDKTDDRSPASPLAVGIYSAEVDFPSAGTWTLAAHVASPRSAVGTQAVQVVDSDIVAALGSKAIAVPTPVATSRHGLAEICTRTPPDPMHYISLDDALRNGKPSVVSFATPLLCESKMCGPVVDEQLLVFEHYGADRANFIHVEEFLPGPDLQPTNSVSPAFRAWRFIDEPWVIVIDGAGEIRARLGPGVTAAAQIDAALSPLL